MVITYFPSQVYTERLRELFKHSSLNIPSPLRVIIVQLYDFPIARTF